MDVLNGGQLVQVGSPNAVRGGDRSVAPEGTKQYPMTH
jgi:hypothetical protein